MKDKKVLVVCGGSSTEREVSLNSGRAVYQALKNAGFDKAELLDIGDDLSPILEYSPDVVFIALHGRGGEDGTIQRYLDGHGISYTGPGVEASAVCMNKILSKKAMVEAGIPTARYTVRKRGDFSSMSASLIKEIGLPMVLKSPGQGSSIGVVIVKDERDMLEGIEEIFRYGDELLAEEFVDGVEVTLPIMGNRELLSLPEIEITSEREFYDYKAKYTSGLCHHIIPSRISGEHREKVRELGERLYKTLGCVGFSRIDFIVDKERGPIAIEVNTVPGMTEMSLFPDAARAAGISFEELVSRIVALALEK